MKTLFVGIMIALGLVASPASAQVPGEIDDKAIERGTLVFRNNCLMCHSAELIESQRLTRTQWEAELTKMTGWGAPVTPEETPDLLVYLMENFGAARSKAEPTSVSVVDIEKSLRKLATADREPLLAANRERGKRLFVTNCASCHGEEALGGPSGTNLVDRPILLQTDHYREVLQKGRNKMPGFASALDANAENDLKQWLMGLPEIAPMKP